MDDRTEAVRAEVQRLIKEGLNEYVGRKLTEANVAAIATACKATMQRLGCANVAVEVHPEGSVVNIEVSFTPPPSPSDIAAWPKRFSITVENEKQKYVVGFLLDPTLSKVVLMRKNRPDFQAGLLNGVGGKVEAGETALDAMRREFSEEAGMSGLEWSDYMHLTTERSEITFFRATGNVHAAVTTTDEPVGVYGVADVMDRCDTMPNIRWCIQMARSFAFGEHAPSFQVKETV